MEAHNKVELHDLAREYSSYTRAVNNEFYRYGEGADIFGAISGGSDDWAHQVGIPISYTIELRDRGHYAFALPESLIEPTVRENMEGIRAVYDHVKAKVTPDTTTQATKTTSQATKTTTTATKPTQPSKPTKPTKPTKPVKTTEAPKEENDCACFEKINVQAAELRRDATLTCLEDKTITTKPGHKLIYVIAECGNKKIKAKKVVCKKKNNVWVPKKNPFMKIINKKC
jgi:hypothetical protein